MTLEQARASKAASVTSGGSTLFVGYRQVGQNQDPVLLRFDGDRRVYCQHHETEPPDGRGYGLTWDGGPKAYVVYTIVGGGSAFDAKAKGGWIDRYGDGGASAKVTVLGEVDAAAGTLLRATFVPAKVVKDGQQKTNTLVPSDAPRVLAAGDIEVTGKSAWSPLNPDRTLMCAAPDTYPGALAGEGSPNFLARFAADLKTLTCASTAACSKVTTPCP